jgi:hypothetical protein
MPNFFHIVWRLSPQLPVTGVPRHRDLGTQGQSARLWPRSVGKHPGGADPLPALRDVGPFSASARASALTARDNEGNPKHWLLTFFKLSESERPAEGHLSLDVRPAHNLRPRRPTRM